MIHSIAWLTFSKCFSTKAIWITIFRVSLAVIDSIQYSWCFCIPLVNSFFASGGLPLSSSASPSLRPICIYRAEIISTRMICSLSCCSFFWIFILCPAAIMPSYHIGTIWYLKLVAWARMVIQVLNWVILANLWWLGVLLIYAFKLFLN